LEVTVDNVHSDQLSQGNLREPINIREREELVIIYKVPTLPKKPSKLHRETQKARTLPESMNIRDWRLISTMVTVTNLPRKPLGVNEHKGKKTIDNNIIDCFDSQETIGSSQGAS
jgi:hypothetical protein